MSGGHCHHHHDEITHNRRVLWIVFALNFGMFLLEIWQGAASNSTSLLADSMDFLSDSFTYLITLYVLTKSLRARATAALIKSGLMLIIAAAVLFQGVQNLLHGQVPEHMTMGRVAGLALAANVASALLLYASRERDSNMRSVWLCSRNDALGNVLVLIAAWLVYATGTLWPDLAAALVISGLATSAAIKIIKQARAELKTGA